MDTGQCDDATARPHPQIARIQREEWLASVDELVAECERLRLMVRARNSCRVREAADQLAADCYGLRTTVPRAMQLPRPPGDGKRSAPSIYT